MSADVVLNNLSRDRTLRDRAASVIPGGMWGHQRAAANPAGHPQFFASGKGAIVTDVDGRDYIDYMCAWGPIILGHQHPAVEAAALGSWTAGGCLNGPSEHAVRLAELMVETMPQADWAMFQKNGGDATTGCVTIARAATRKRKVLVARGAYHGAIPWCTPSLAGVTEEDRAHIMIFDYNDTDSLAAAVAEAGDDLAAILVSAFRHDLGHLELPTADFAKAVRAACDASGAALILDDVRAGFRLDLEGSWAPFGIRPDLSAFSKAIANGHPLSAITGNDRFREAATQVFVTGSFWYTGAPMAAAVATIEELHRVDGPELMRASGQRLRDGLAEQAARHGFEITQSGPPVMPLIQFAGDTPEARTGETFCQEALKRGVYMHHRHNMFLGTAHDFEVIDRTLEATEGAFAALAKGRKANE